MEEKSNASDYCDGDQGLLRMFKRDFEKFPLLSREEEIAVARRARHGDQAAVDLLIESSLRLVVYVVRKHWYPGLPLMDMISEGCSGLMPAAKGFDPERGFRFISYAIHAITNRVRSCLGDYYKNKHASLDEPVYDAEDETTFKDILAANDPSVDETAANKQVHRVLVVLDERERRVIMLRFWMDLGLKETAAKIGLSRSYVTQIENGALRKMRQAMTGGLITGYQKTPSLRA